MRFMEFFGIVLLCFCVIGTLSIPEVTTYGRTYETTGCNPATDVYLNHTPLQNYTGYTEYDQCGNVVGKGISYTITEQVNSYPISSYAKSSEENTCEKEYIDISKGIRISTKEKDDYVIWNNGYKNGEITILFKSDSDKSYNSFKTSVGDAIELSYDKNTQITVKDETINIGNWNTFLLKLNTVNGIATVQPINSFTDYLDFKDLGKYIYVGNISKKPIEEIYWDYTESSFGTIIKSTTCCLSDN
ncbi:MAG: hypothetical protein MJY64_02950 [archaeon]|nr:hypothetical protein [archaeon]